MTQFYLFLNKSEAQAAERAGVLGASEVEALKLDRPFSYVGRDVGMWMRATLHPVRMMPTGNGPKQAASPEDV